MDVISDQEKRREIRKRKILANSKSRIERINGCTVSQDTEDRNDHVLSSRAETEYICPDPPDGLLSEVLNDSSSISAHSAHQESTQPPNIDLSEFLRGGIPDADHVRSGTDSENMSGAFVWWKRWNSYRTMLVVFLAVFMRLLLLTESFNFLAQNMLTPFIVVQLTLYFFQIIYIPASCTPGMMEAVLMLMCGGEGGSRLAGRLRQWLRYAAFVATAVADLVLYTFCVIVMFILLPHHSANDTTRSTMAT